MSTLSVVQPLSAPAASLNPHIDCSVLLHCRKAYEEAYSAALATHSEIEAQEVAGNAYREALPPLLGSTNIRRFIACVTQGMLLGILSYQESARLLYAAQAANSAFRKALKPRKTPSKSVA